MPQGGGVCAANWWNALWPAARVAAMLRSKVALIRVIGDFESRFAFFQIAIAQGVDVVFYGSKGYNMQQRSPNSERTPAAAEFGGAGGPEGDAMTDVVKIARECRATLEAELARIDDFIRMAEALIKYSEGKYGAPTADAGRAAPETQTADSTLEDSFTVGEVNVCDGVSDGDGMISSAATTEPAASARREILNEDSGSATARDGAPIPRTDLASVDPDHFAFDEEAAVNAEELVLINPLSSDPGPVDVHIGQRLRQRRWMIGMSQQQLGDTIGVNFDQIQKFETGASRISVRCMWDIAAAIEVPVSYFFENLEGQAEDAGATRGEVLTDEKAMELVSGVKSARRA